jgi:tetratricopeptide (TPR) repeat protein
MKIGSISIGLLIVMAGGFLSAQTSGEGIKLYKDGKLPEAKSVFEAVITAEPKNSEALCYLAMIHLSRTFRDLDKAEGYIDEALEIEPNSAMNHFVRGQVLGLEAQSSNIVSAGFIAPKVKKEFLRAVELDPTFVQARMGLFSYLLMAPGIMGGSEEEALQQAKEIVTLDPFQGHLTMASYYQKKKDAVKTEEEIKKAISAKPESGAGYHRLGYFLLNQNRHLDAVVAFKKYIDADPKNPDAYDSLADAYLAMEKYDEAIEKYNYALYLNKTYASSIYGLARCYELKGMNVKAKETYQWYLVTDPKGNRADEAQKKIKELG